MVSAPKLIYFVTEDWYFCSHRLPLAVAVKAAGFDVAVITRVRDDAAKIREAGIRVIPFESERRSLNPIALIGAVIRLRRLYREEKPDIVHHVALKPVILGSTAAKLAGLSCVVNAVAGLGWLYSSSSRAAVIVGRPMRQVLKCLLSHGKTIVQNPDDLAWLVGVGVRGESISLIRGSGVDVQEFRPVRPISGDPIVVLVARMLWDKGVGEFVEAANRIRQDGGRARFVLVGAPDNANPSAIPEAKLREWADEGAIEWWGKRSDVAEILAGAHIACLPSYYGEGVPKSLLEAAAAGLPIVTTDAPGCREVVLHDENGLLVTPRDVDSLADALMRLIGSPALRERMGRRSRELAMSEFSVDRVISATLGLYREMME